MSETEHEERPELMALTEPPSKKVCAFNGMTSFGSHYRVDMEEAGSGHVTFDCGVAELQTRRRVQGSSNPLHVELVRVGVLKNILVFCYGNMNIVVMVVSWVAKHTDESPRLRRDCHGFWLANMAARPHDTTNPYLLPALASQVAYTSFPSCLLLGIAALHVACLTLHYVCYRFSSWRTRACQAGQWS